VVDSQSCGNSLRIATQPAAVGGAPQFGLHGSEPTLELG
jgi:hypothetical protein